MTEITILSGKGGTGKTTISAALATLAENAVFCDNDVDAPDLHLIFKPQIKEEFTFLGAWLAHIDTKKCSACGLCASYCRFDAITYNNDNYFINEIKCEGCRLCERICPEQAIVTTQSTKNRWFVSSSRFGFLIHAMMAPGEENSGKLVSTIRKKAREIALENHNTLIINDGPPGIGCPVISSITGTNKVLVIIEPSLSALHDAKRVASLVKGFEIPLFAVINKYDINNDVTLAIEQFLEESNIPLLEKLPYDRVATDAMVVGQSVVEYAPQSSLSKKLQKVWSALNSLPK